MRMLVTFAGGWGHLAPLRSVIDAASADGHDVLVGSRPSLLAPVVADGLTAVALGPGAPGSAGTRSPLRRLDPEHEEAVVAEHYAGRLARERAPAVLALVATWRPDVIVCDEMDLGAVVAAERLGVPCATVVVLAAGTFPRLGSLAEPLAALRGAHGLPPDPALHRRHGDLVLEPVPPGFREPAAALPVESLAFDRWRGGAGTGPAPRWSAAARGRPVVYATLGSEFPLEAGDLLERVVAGLRRLDVAAVVTVGRDRDPAELGPLPSYIHVARWLPHAEILPRCHVVVSHGGSGTLVDALAHGLPSAVLPMGADQGHNAARCVALGVGHALDAVDASPEEIAAAVRSLLEEPGPRLAAARLRDAYRTLPGPEGALARLVRLAGQAIGERTASGRWKQVRAPVWQATPSPAPPGPR